MNLPRIDLFLLLEQFPNSIGKGIKVIKIVQNLASILLDPEKIKHQHHFAVSSFFFFLESTGPVQSIFLRTTTNYYPKHIGS